MDTTLYVGLSHQTAMLRRMDLVANNVANMNTSGYQREDVLFEDYLMKMPGVKGPAGRNVAYVLDQGIARDFSGGPLQQTGNPLDIAIEGDGFFTVQTDTGLTRYTRNGHFNLNADGQLVLDTGELVLDDNGNPISITPDDKEIAVNREGEISSTLGTVATLGVVDFADRRVLEKAGDTLYRTDAPTVPVANIRLSQGAIELSNVNAVEEITDMIKVLRSYQGITRLLEDYQQLRGRAIRQLGRIS